MHDSRFAILADAIALKLIRSATKNDFICMAVAITIPFTGLSIKSFHLIT